MCLRVPFSFYFVIFSIANKLSLFKQSKDAQLEDWSADQLVYSRIHALLLDRFYVGEVCNADYVGLICLRLLLLFQVASDHARRFSTIHVGYPVVHYDEPVHFLATRKTPLHQIKSFRPT